MPFISYEVQCFEIKHKGKSRTILSLILWCQFRLSVRLQRPDRYWTRFVYHCYLLVNHTTMLDDLSNWSYKWITKNMRRNLNNSILRRTIICTIYTLETQRTFFWWWWISERSRINCERSSMIRNLVWRWFENNVVEKSICWSCIFAKCIFSYRDTWPKWPATSRSLWRILWIVLVWSANKNLGQIILSLKIDLWSWIEKATTIRIDLCISQRYDDIKWNKMHPVVLEVLEYEDHHLKKSNVYCCIIKQIPLIYDQEKYQQKDNED